MGEVECHDEGAAGDQGFCFTHDRNWEECAHEFQRRALTAEAELSEARREIERLSAEVREWVCRDCRWVYPGPPQKGLYCVICPRCEGTTAPKVTVEKWAAEALATQRGEALRDVAEALALCDKHTEGYSMGEVTTVIDAVRLTARAALTKHQATIDGVKEQHGV